MVQVNFEGYGHDIVKIALEYRQQERSYEQPIITAQYVVLHFVSIGGRGKPEKYEWHAQEEFKQERFEVFLRENIRGKFKEYPVIFGAVPPHTGTLFAFGGSGQSDNNIYRIAKLEVEGDGYHCGLKLDKQAEDSCIGCPLDLKVMNYELDRWLATGKDPKNWCDQWRDPSDIVAKVAIGGDPSRSGI